MNFARRLLIALALMMSIGGAEALEMVPFTQAALDAAQKSGRPVALHFHADWCPTCRAQTKALNTMKSDSSLALTILVVDFDKERELKRKLGVRAQSTLIVYKGQRETARLAGQTEAEALTEALRTAL